MPWPASDAIRSAQWVRSPAMTSWSIHRSGRSAANRSTEPAAASSCFTSSARPSGSIWMLPVGPASSGLGDVWARQRPREDRAIGQPTGQLQRAWSSHAGQHRGSARGRMVQPNAVEPDVVTGDGHRFAGQQRPYRLDVLGERGQRRRRVRADLAHPPGHAVAEADNQPGGIQLGQRGDLHRRECGIAGHRRHDAQADDQPVGAGQRSGYGSDPAGEEAVLGQPELVKAGRFGSPRVRRDVCRRQLRRHAQTDPGT